MNQIPIENWINKWGTNLDREAEAKLREAVVEMILDEASRRNAENSRLKLQLEKVLEAFSPDDNVDHCTPCPSNVGLTDSLECGKTVECPQCWRDALEAVGGVVKHEAS